jgi:hypothetical protein
VDFTDPVIPAYAGIQVRQRIVGRLSSSKEFFSAGQIWI